MFVVHAVSGNLDLHLGSRLSLGLGLSLGRVRAKHTRLYQLLTLLGSISDHFHWHVHCQNCHTYVYKFLGCCGTTRTEHGTKRREMQVVCLDTGVSIQLAGAGVGVVGMAELP